MNKKLRQLAITIVLWTVLIPHTRGASADESLYNQTSPEKSYINLGTLDVKPIATPDSKNPDWFIEYLKPGQQKQEQIQISNFSNTKKDLQIYVTDTAINQNTKFYTKRLEENPDYINKWIHLPTQTLTLNPQESRVLSVNIILPNNAGVGLHTGAIMVREIFPATDPLLKDLAIEKGVRVYLNVIGPAITNGSIQNIKTAESKNTYALTVQSQNHGTTDYENTYALEIKDLFGNTISQSETESITKPGTTKETPVSTLKPHFGLFTATLSDQNHTYFTKPILFIPFWSILLAILILTVSLSTKIRPATATPINYFKSLGRSSRLSPVFQRSAAYILLLTLTATLTFTFANLNISLGAHTSIQPASACCYNLTIKWGDFRDIRIPKTATNEWHGKIQFINAHVSTTELLNFERNDKAEITEENRALRFDLLTGPDNDGIELKVAATSNETPIIKYEDYVTNQTFEFPITAFIDSPGTFPSKIFGIYFKAEPYKNKVSRTAGDIQLIEDLSATPQLEATPQAAQFPELENLFINDLPATPEVLADFILESDYVTHVTDMEQTKQFETDSILLKAFEATPEIIQILSATPDLNYLFIPGETILFPPLEFSFDQERITTQQIGTLIFVQNKGTPWNTFVSTTDFQLLSGTTQLPTSYVTINPGEPQILLQTLTSDKEEERIYNDKITRKPIEPRTLPATEELTVTQPEFKDALSINERDDKETTPDKSNINGKDQAPGQNNEDQISSAETKIKDEKDKVKTGDKKAFLNKEYKSTLVEVDESQNKIIFILRPTIEIRVPPSTPAGTYNGMLTITSV